MVCRFSSYKLIATALMDAESIIMSLTPKQKRFCEEYTVDFNGTQAAINQIHNFQLYQDRYYFLGVAQMVYYLQRPNP